MPLDLRAAAEIAGIREEPPCPGGPSRPAEALPLVPARLARAKRSYATRHLPLSAASHLVVGDATPRSGDLVLARVQRIGHHSKLELAHGRRAQLHVGDEILLAFADRYASDQFEARVPPSLDPCHLVAAGGIAGWASERHARTRRPTEIVPVGLLADAAGRPLNLATFAPLPLRTGAVRRPRRVVVVLGTSMNAGKTTTVVHLVRGMLRCGLRVGAVKVTGTGAGGDRWAAIDAGADPVLDFTDLGYPSTHRLPPSTHLRIFETLLDAQARQEVDVAVVEVADGLLFEETARLVGCESFRRMVDGILLAAGDAMGALGALRWLESRELSVCGISGLVTASALAMRELRAAIGLAVVTPEALAEARWLPPMVAQVA